MTDDDHKDDPTEPEPSPNSLEEQRLLIRAGRTAQETANTMIMFLTPEARGKAVDVAARHLGLSSDAPTVLQSDLVRVADLASLADQTEGRRTETLNIIIKDPESTCSQFGYDKGSLTEEQAQILFKEIVKGRGIEEQHERELEKTLFGFVGRFFSWIAKGGSGAS